MGNQHRISDDKEFEQSNMQTSKLKNYKDFLRLLISSNIMDLDVDIDTDADKNTQIIKENFHGR